MADSREILTTRLEHYLGTLVSRVEIAARNNLPTTNVVAETTLAGLLNRVYGWNLVNANAISQNYPGVDLIDQERRIAVQVTSTRSVEKVKNTLAKAAGLGVTFQNLIVLIITNQPATPAMQACTVPGYTGLVELWNIPDVFRRAKELGTDQLQEIVAYLEAELGLSGEVSHLVLPLYSALQGSDFIGRETELKDIDTRFSQGSQLVVLTGLGGMGKTELAVQYGRTHGGRVYFAHFDGSFTRTLARMAEGIRPALSKETLRQDDTVLSAMVLKLLECSDKADLLIIDNADSPTGDLSALQKDPGWIALCKLPLKLLLTTRSAATRPIPVEAMARETLFDIFRKHGNHLQRREMEDLIDAVNGHTLTVDLIARTLNGGGLRKVTAAMMLKALRENTLPTEKYKKIATDYHQSTEQARIYQHLSTVFDVATMSDVEKRLLGIATLFPESGIDGDLIADIVTEEQTALYETLISRGWLEIRNDLLTIHPVIRLVCRTEIPPTDGSCYDFLNGLIKQYDENHYDKDRYRQMAELLSNASHNLEDAAGNYSIWSALLWHALGNFRQALEYDLRAMKKREETLPPDHPNLAMSYNNVGTTYSTLGDHRKELEYQLKALGIWGKAFPPDHPQLALSYNNVGSAYGNLGDHNKALEYQLKTLAIFEKVLPQDHPHLAASCNNAGLTYGELGDHNKALEYLLKALDILEKALPPDHPDLAASCNNVGLTYSHLDDHTKALEYLLKALAIREKALPWDHPDLALSCNNIAGTYHAIGQYPEAARYMRRAADIVSRSALPEDHPNRVNYPKWAEEIEMEANMQQP